MINVLNDYDASPIKIDSVNIDEINSMVIYETHIKRHTISHADLDLFLKNIHFDQEKKRARGE